MSTQPALRALVVLPFFLRAGHHVAQDIPQQVAIAQHHYPPASG